MGKISKILIALFLFISVAHAQKLYTGGEKYEKDGVDLLLSHGKMIEWVYKENLAQCLKSKRVLTVK